MSSATASARAATIAALDAASDLDLDVARELFAADRALADAPQLSGALADWGAPAAARSQLVSDLFAGQLGATTISLLSAVVAERWSSSAALIDGVEELAVRAAARAQPDADVEGELFQFSRTVATAPDLELALGSSLGDAAVKGELVQSLLQSRASEATTLIVSSLVQRPRGRRMRRLLARAERIVAQERGRVVARVTSATPLGTAQADRLRDALARKYGRDVALNTIVDPSLVGGLRVQIGDDVIDASVSSRLADLRQRLAG